MKQRAKRNEPMRPREVVDGYYAAPGVGPFSVPVEPADTHHDGYEPIRRRRPGERRERPIIVEQRAVSEA